MAKLRLRELLLIASTVAAAVLILPKESLALEPAAPETRTAVFKIDDNIWKVDLPLKNVVAKKPDLRDFFFRAIGAPDAWTTKPNPAKIQSLSADEKILGQTLLKIASEVDQEPQGAVLELKDGRATNFTPHVNGRTLDLARSRRKIYSEIQSSLSTSTQIELIEKITAPKVRLADLNDLGIKELIAVGKSDFSGSSAARINNVRVGASKYNGVIIMPGEEFSFNAHLGPVDAEHGFKPELVIKPEGATPEFGGGLCQVSTTAFRAAFFGGLPITARRNHSYAVHYYEWIDENRPRAVGLDATIYSPSQDMKFINDTAGAILIWTKIEGKRLHFEFYGTPDGRQVTVDGPHPYDQRSSGAVKSTVTRAVKKIGQEPQEITLNSIYVPPKIYKETLELPGQPAPPTTPPPIPEPIPSN